MPKAQRTPAALLLAAGSHAAIHDLKGGAKAYDLTNTDDVARAAQDIWSLQKQRLARAYGVAVDTYVAEGRLDEAAAFKAVMAYGAKGAIPHLKKLIAAPTAPVFAPPVEAPQLGLENLCVSAKTSGAAPDVTQSRSLQTLETPAVLAVEGESAPVTDDACVDAPVAPATPSGPFMAEPNAGYGALVGLFGQQNLEDATPYTAERVYREMMEGQVCIEHCSSSPAARNVHLLNEALAKTRGQDIDPFSHDPRQLSKEPLDVLTTAAVGHHARSQIEMGHLLERTEGLSGLTALPLQQQGSLFQSSRFGYAESFRANFAPAKQDHPDLTYKAFLRTGEDGSHFHGYHDDILPNIAVARTELNREGAALQTFAAMSFVPRDDATLQMAVATQGDLWGVQGLHQRVISPDKRLVIETQGSLSRQENVTPSPDLALRRYTAFEGQSTLLYSLPDVTIGAGITARTPEPFGAVKPGLRIEASMLDPWTAQHGLRAEGRFDRAGWEAGVLLAANPVHIDRSVASVSYRVGRAMGQPLQHSFAYEWDRPLSHTLRLTSHGEAQLGQQTREGSLSLGLGKTVDARGRWTIGSALALQTATGVRPVLSPELNLRYVHLASGWLGQVRLRQSVTSNAMPQPAAELMVGRFLR